MALSPLEYHICNGIPFEFDVANTSYNDRINNYLLIGHTETLGTSKRVIWNESTDYVFPTSALNMSVVSTSDEDKPANSGGHTVLIQGLDINYDIISETVTLNGLTPVATVNNYFRINNVYIATAGSNGYGVGKITVSNGGTVYSSIKGESNRCFNGFFTVPNGKDLYLKQINYTCQIAAEIEVEIWVRSAGGLFKPIYKFTNFQQQHQFKLYVPIQVETKSDIMITGLATTENNHVDILMEYILADDV